MTHQSFYSSEIIFSIYFLSIYPSILYHYMGLVKMMSSEPYNAAVTFGHLVLLQKKVKVIIIILPYINYNLET